MSDQSAIASSADVRSAAWSWQPWLQAEALDALAELNEQCLELLREQAAACSARFRPALLVRLQPLWAGLEGAARRRAARCPFLLVDAGFTRTDCPPWLRERAVRDRDWPPVYGAFFTVSRTIPVTRLVLAYGWHLACSESAAARLFLGMSAHCAESIAACTLRRMMQVAESEPHLLRPRWPDRPEVWRELLIAASGGEPSAMDRFRIRGLQLLAADARGGDETA